LHPLPKRLTKGYAMSIKIRFSFECLFSMS
jgi:hypothetical protein